MTNTYTMSKHHALLSAVKGWHTDKNKESLDQNLEKLFGENILLISHLESKLSAKNSSSLRKIINEGGALEREVADEVASVIKEWSIERGATRYTHWFQPLTGLTAEKHESFIYPNPEGKAISYFSGRDLLQGEPDASSFPSGGSRATFEARGYTAWDPGSPIFLMENERGKYICIPSAFVSWSGESLDHKIPLLRSIDALNKQVKRVLKLFSVDVNKIKVTVGSEQEFFLIDHEFFYRRPDLLSNGRTIIGAKSPRGQELSDHYFGHIPDRVLAFMFEVERELYRLAIPLKTCHNEVAPSQYEMALLFESANIAADHQQLMMVILRKVAKRYGLECLLHEKPFQGLNGSGKHLNWSIATEDNVNLLDPGNNLHDNIQFLFFFIATLTAIYRHQDLLRISISSAGNDYRLGGHEAPPSTISAYIGEPLERAIMNLITDSFEEMSNCGELLGFGTPVLPPISKHAGDRNRTSPFAFTGNKFEFRAVGSHQSISFPTTILNTIVTEALDDMVTDVEKQTKTGLSLEKSILSVLKSYSETMKPIIYNQNGYSEEWVREAENRQLLNLKTSVDAYFCFYTSGHTRLFKKYNILSEREMKLRHNILYSQYVATQNIELETMISLIERYILPVSMVYMGELSESLTKLKKLEKHSSTIEHCLNQLLNITDQLYLVYNELKQNKLYMDKECKDDKAKSSFIRDKVLDQMDKVRTWIDQLEGMVPDNHWPFPSYYDMLFIK